MNIQTKSTLSGAVFIACFSLITSVHSGIITEVDSASPTAIPGFGAWNLDNVNVIITWIDSDPDNPYVVYDPYVPYDPMDKWYDPEDGSYSAMEPNDSFESLIYDGNPTLAVDDPLYGDTVMGRLHGKDWPIGEPSGVQVLTDTLIDAPPEEQMPNGKSDSCIMTTSYDPEAEGFHLVHPEVAVQTVCSSPFQSHKRFKINLQPSTVDGVSPEDVDSVDMVFNVEGPAVRHVYQVYQKINNYTGARLSGYTLEVGFGVGVNFVNVNEVGNAFLLTELNLNIGEGDRPNPDPDTGLNNIWDVDQMANFSHGLWGPIDEPKYFLENGFFSDIRTGYVVSLNDDATKISSGIPLDEHPEWGGNYELLFGEWLPSIWQPEAILWDDDDNPATDDTLMAFWADIDGDDPDGDGIGEGDGTYAWTYGFANNFELVPAATLSGWAANRIYYLGFIEDVLNLGLNYNVEVGNISIYPTFDGVSKATFTIRVTPIKAAEVTQVEPGWITNPAVFDKIAFNPAIITYLLF